MPTFKQTLIPIGDAIGTPLNGGAFVFISEAHLELSFDKLTEFSLTNFDSYSQLITSINFDFLRKRVNLYRADYGENDNGTTRISRADISFRYFRFSSRIAGTSTEHPG